MATVSTNGIRERFMKVNGKEIKCMGKVRFGILQGIFILVNFTMRRCMGLECIYMLMEVAMKVIGSKMSKREWEKKFG